MADRRDQVLDVVVGLLVGGVVGGIAAVNVVIFFSGLPSGYESTLPEVFRQNFALGLVVVGLLMAGPLAGVWLMRRRRSR